jgi:hypothetical protein
VHAVGFSLGAHIAAYASNFLQLYSGQRFNRITGKQTHVKLALRTRIEEKNNKEVANAKPLSGNQKSWSRVQDSSEGRWKNDL